MDQPAGTGYSYTNSHRYVHSGTEAAQQIVTFLHNFYTVFPEFERMDLYVAGESFAGIWIPYLVCASIAWPMASLPDELAHCTGRCTSFDNENQPPASRATSG